MINIHLNGDIVRCPDISAIKKKIAEDRDARNICRYNIHENQCPAWKSLQQTALNEANFDNKRYIYGSRCHLVGCELCPGHQRQCKTGNQKKSFKIDNTVYRKIASSAHYLVKESNYKSLFITLTFPKFIKKVTDNEINDHFSKFVENLRKNYNCGGYIAARERGAKGNRVHFHLLLSIPFIDFRILNDSWCNCIKDISIYSRNALTSDPKTLFIKNPERAMRYACKYFSKCKNQVSETRLVFVSNNILQRPRQMRANSEYGFLDSFKFDYMRKTSDYTTLFRISDPVEFNRFCREFLYPFFELSVKNKSPDDKKDYDLYSFPGK